MRSSLVFLLVVALWLPIAMANDYLEIGYAEVDITPEIVAWEDADGDGKYTFGDGSPYDTGEKVTRFAEGKIYVGNGKGEAQYIHDPIYARIMVLCDPATGNKVALVSFDLYMLQRPDAQFIRGLVADMKFSGMALHATHSHMGPDTLGRSGVNLVNGINGLWLRKMQYNTAQAIRDAYKTRVPAKLRFLKTSSRFGLNDTRDPLIYDDDLVGMQAVDKESGEVLVTLVQWSNHVEAILSIHRGPGAPADMKEKTGRIITAGFPGHVARRAEEVFGGHGIFFNGAVGGLLTMLHTFVWKPFEPYSPDTPIDQIPPDYPGKIHDNFQMAELIGNELVDKLHREKLLEQPFETGLSVNASSTSFKVPVDNALFRAGFLAGIIGFDKRKFEGDLLGEAFIFSEVSLIDLGAAQIACVPGELVPEYSVGLPKDFLAKNSKYYKNPEHHKTGADFVVPRFAKGMMTAKYRMLFGLTNDSLGYMVAPCDFKLHETLPWIEEPEDHYEETQSVSQQVTDKVMDSLAELLSEKK